MAKVSINQIAGEITRAVKEYTQDVADKVEMAKNDISKQVVKDLKEKSPKETGDYAKGWTRKEAGSSYIIHNPTEYRLAHLLEYGHANVFGGRVPAKPHIRPVEEKAVNEFTERVEKAIKS